MNRLFAALASLLAAPLAAAPFAYVSNEGSASVSVIDVATGLVASTIATGAKPRGIAVHVAARVMGLGEAGDVLVSAMTHDLVAGSGLEFDDRGEHALKGVEGPRRVYAAL